MPSSGSVLVTGASTGIGAACAVRLDQAGYRVFAGVRDPDAGERLRRQASARLQWVELDVTREDQVRHAALTIERDLDGRGLDGLVNNAGVAVGGPLEFVPIQDLRRQLEVNVVGLLAVTQMMLSLIRRARGRIVNIGSIAGLSVTPMVGPYCASKHAVEALTDALRLELAGWGIHVAVVEPGTVRTPLWDKAAAEVRTARDRLPARAFELYGTRLETMGRLVEANSRRGVTADQVAAVVQHALDADLPRTRYLVGTDARIRALLSRVLPDTVLDGLIHAFLGRVERRTA